MIKYKIDVPEHNVKDGLSLEWNLNFELSVKEINNQVIVKGNTAGLISLARHCLTLALNKVPNGYHLHFDDINSLEDGSKEFVIEKK